MTYTEINQKIDVIVYFSRNGTVKPKYFFWKNQKYNVKKITYLWSSYEGETKFLHFTVYDGTNIFELKLNMKTFEWYLHRIITY